MEKYVPFLLPDRRPTHRKWETIYSESSATETQDEEIQGLYMKSNASEKAKSKTQTANL